VTGAELSVDGGYTQCSEFMASALSRMEFAADLMRGERTS